LPGVTGVLVLEVPVGSVPAKCGLQKGDVILSLNGTRMADVATLLQQAPALADFQSILLGISRQQKEISLNITR
jgi:S1-C subfamily serine protease